MIAVTQGKKDAGSYSPVSLTLISGNIIEQIILSAITTHVEQLSDQNQSIFMKGRFCLMNWISFRDKMIHLMDEGNAVNVVYLDFSQVTLFLMTFFWKN